MFTWQKQKNNPKVEVKILKLNFKQIIMIKKLHNLQDNNNRPLQ